MTNTNTKDLFGLMRIGQTVVDSDNQTNFSSQELNECFGNFTQEEKNSLKRGSIVWVREPYSLDRNLSGYTLGIIRKPGPDPDFFQIEIFEFSRPLVFWERLFKVTDMHKLVELITANQPHCFNVGTDFR